MMRYSSFPGCLLYFPGCLIFSFLLSRTDFVVVSKNVPDNRLRLTQDPKGNPQLTQKKNFDELGTIRLQENVVVNESHEQTPADKISKTLNARLDSDAKSFESKNVSPETQMKRIRRNPNYAVFDEEEIGNLTDIAIQQCPYNAFCHRNRTTVPKFRAGYGSCCKDCYCDEQCGERMDCCWDFIDTTKIEEKNALTCITPVILPANEQLEDDPSYLMVDSCHGNDSYECRSENAAVWGPLFPASSPSTSMIYFNKDCAKCNGVTDSTPWDTYVSCNGTNSLSGSSLIGGLKRKQCRVRFRPPKKANTEKFTCNAEIISTCSLTERPFKTNVDLEKACRLTKANVIAKNRDEVGYLTYANIFCKLCEGHVHYPDGACRAVDLYRSPAVTKFTTFIDWRLLDSVASDAIDTTDTSKRRQKQKMCGENEVKHPTKDECRELICPYGAIRTPDGCKLFAKTWFVPGYEIHVIMTPVSEHKIPLEEFNKITEREPNMNNWLDTKGLDINHLIMFAEEAVQDNITLLGVMNIRLGSDKFPLNAQKLLKAIEKSISRQWAITLDKTVYTYEVEFDIYEKFVQTGEDYRKRWAGTDPQLSSGSTFESYMLPKVYTSVLFRTKIIGLQISKMYFCEKVELFEVEWSGAYNGIWLNLTGSGNDTYLGDGEFSYEDDFYGTKVVKVEICVDDFLAQFGSTMNAANLCGYTRYLFLFLELVVIFA